MNSDQQQKILIDSREGADHAEKASITLTLADLVADCPAGGEQVLA
jgi:hypothetical protein